jgi:siderophore synthetase component
MRLQDVRRWARGRGVSASDFQQVYNGALLHVISRLLQAIHRESQITRLSQDTRGRWYLDVGRGPILRAPASGPLPFRRVEIIDSPWIIGPGKRYRFWTAKTFLRALRPCLARSEYSRAFRALRADFENSVANVLLNRLIARSLRETAGAIEPAYQGHQYYPFPALRIGPTLSQVLKCSHLCHEPIDLPLLEIRHCRLVSLAFRSYEQWLHSWSGLQAEPGTAALLPVHPWHLRLSPILRTLLAKKLVGLVRGKIEVIPLASQRTCRVVRTGFDLKLPVDATLTGEHRLLYGLNCENAPVISALAKRLLSIDGCSAMDFQEDLASIFHTQPELAPHLSAIIRSPVPIQPGESVVPAINLWAGRCEAQTLLRAADSARIECFFYRYCRALMTGPVQYCSQWGMAFEPHLQNVYVAMREGLPSRIVLRDLDASILDKRRIRPVLRDLGLDLAQDTWRAMPPFEIGSKRLVQAMLFGHLGEVMWHLTQTTGIKSDKLVSIVEDTWSDLSACAPSIDARRSVWKLRGWSGVVKATLRTRLNRSTAMEFVNERDAMPVL